MSRVHDIGPFPASGASGGALALLRGIEREQIVGAALLGLATAAPKMIQWIVDPYPASLHEFLGVTLECVLWAFALLVLVVRADGRVEDGARAVTAYAIAVAGAAILRPVLACGTELLFWDAFLDPSERLWTRLQSDPWRVASRSLYMFFESSLMGGLATYLYVDRRDVRKMVRRLHDAGLRRSVQAREMLESQLQAMQARVEPQFLFGTLAQVRDFYASDPARAERVLDELIAYLRAAMPRMRDTSSTLAQELELVRAYLAIVHVRLGARLNYEIGEPEGSVDIRMPPMMLLPLVDHAIVYGIERRAEAGTIRIATETSGGRLRLTIAHSGAGFASDGGGEDIASIRERLAALYGDDARLDLRRTDANATEAVLAVPLEIRRDEAPLPG